MTSIANECIHEKANQQNVNVDVLSLVFLVILVVSGLVFAALSATSLLPWRSIASSGSVLKFIVLLPLLLAAVISTLTTSLNRIAAILWVAVKTNWFLTLFVILALPGSIYARFVMKQPSSFFSQAFMILSFFAAYFIFLRIPEPYWLRIRLWLARTFGFLALVAAISVIVNISNGFEKSHQFTALLLLQGIGLVFYDTNRLIRIIFLFVLTTFTFLTFKNTAIIILVIVYFGFYLFPKSSLRKTSISNVLVLMIIGVVIFASIGISYILWQSEFSTFSDGNTPFRLFLYEYRFHQFLDSPFYGQLFTGETAYQFESSFNRAIVPTHSDWLDVLAQGGLIGVSLFTGAFIHFGRLLIKYRKWAMPLDLKASQLASWLLIFELSIVILFMFNPTFHAPDISLIFWVAMAFGYRLIASARKNIISRFKIKPDDPELVFQTQ